jgi:hypothetical protein
MALTEYDFVQLARRHGISDERACYYFKIYDDGLAKAKAALIAAGKAVTSTPDHIAILDCELLMLVGEAAAGNETAREHAIEMLEGGNEQAQKIREALIKGRPKKKGFLSKLFGG